MESGSLRGSSSSGSGGTSHRWSFEVSIGGRLTELGTLLGRSQGGSHAHGISGSSWRWRTILPKTV